MADIKLFYPIVCPSCRETNQWAVALGFDRVILDCKCTYRISLPLDNEALKGRMYNTMPLEYDENKKIKN